jgi:molybdopterin molybdotransferase
VDEGAELILTSAGVSVGAYDFVRVIVEQEGRLEFWKVNMRPGKPLAFGSFRDVPFIGLPGNPVSAFVGFQVFVRPALQKMAGLIENPLNTREVELAEDIQSDGRQTYMRAFLSEEGGRWLARLTGHQGSGNLLSLVQANALLIVPSGVKSVPRGTKATAWLFD